uniref:Uncharacterized protein n=1 Tax=Arundo donax TaxID=35708 RepID=A0A0A9EGU0_ARUDO
MVLCPQISVGAFPWVAASWGLYFVGFSFLNSLYCRPPTLIYVLIHRLHSKLCNPNKCKNIPMYICIFNRYASSWCGRLDMRSKALVTYVEMVVCVCVGKHLYKNIICMCASMYVCEGGHAGCTFNVPSLRCMY